jgi:hypothetical protein
LVPTLKKRAPRKKVIMVEHEDEEVEKSKNKINN